MTHESISGVERERGLHNILVLEHEIVGEHNLKTSNVLNTNVIEEGNKAGSQTNKKCKGPFQDHILSYLSFVSSPPVMFE